MRSAHRGSFCSRVWRSLPGPFPLSIAIVISAALAVAAHADTIPLFLHIVSGLSLAGCVWILVPMMLQAGPSGASEPLLQRKLNLYISRNTINQAIISIREREALLSAICEAMVEQGPFRMVWISLLDPATRRVYPVAHAGTDSGSPAISQMIAESESSPSGCATRALHTKSLAVCNDMTSDSGNEPWVAEAVRRGFRSSASIPVYVGGEVAGILNVMADEAMLFGDEEKQFLIDVAQDLTFGLNTMMIESERQNAERKLRQREQLFQTLSAISPVGIFRADAAGKLIYANERWCNIAGMQVEAAAGDGWFSAIHPSDRESVHAAWARFLQDESSFRLEFRFSTAPGNETWVLGEAAPERGRARSIVGYVASVTDISELKSAEAAMRASEERFRETFEQAAVGIAHVGSDGSWLRVNKKLCDIVGYTREELLTMTFQDITHPEDLDADLAFVRQVLEGTIKTYSMVKRYVHKDRSIVWINLTVSLVRDPRDEPLYFISVVEDITEKQLAQDALRASDAKFAAFMDNLPGYAYIKDASGRHEFANRAYEKLLRIESRQWKGKTLDQLIEPGQCEDINRNDRLIIENHTSLLVEEALAIEGQTYTLLSSKFPIDDRSGSVLLGGVSIDVTHRKETDRALRTTTDELRALTAHLHNVRELERTRIAREVHDELGQFLTALKLNLATLGREYAEGLSADQKRSFLDELNGMSVLVDNGLRAVRRIIRELRPEPLDNFSLGEALQWQAQEFKARTGIECSIDVHETEIDAKEDTSTVLFRVFQEALTNIARHAYATQVAATLAMSESSLVLTVADNGVGMESTTSLPRESFGLLGMRERIASLGGRLSIESRLGAGTTISVEIPLRPLHDAPGDNETRQGDKN